MSDKVLDFDLVLKLHSGLEVIKSQQSDINRRLGNLEKRLEDKREKEEDSKPRWKEWIFQAVAWGIGITIVVTLGNVLGVEVKW